MRIPSASALPWTVRKSWTLWNSSSMIWTIIHWPFIFPFISGSVLSTTGTCRPISWQISPKWLFRRPALPTASLFSIFNEEFRQQITPGADPDPVHGAFLKNGDFVPYFSLSSISGPRVSSEPRCWFAGITPSTEISPASFIPVFEKNGFIIQLDQYIWEEAAKLLWRRKKREQKKDSLLRKCIQSPYF